MDLSRCQPQLQKVYSRIRKRTGKVGNGNVGRDKQNWCGGGDIDKLPDDVLVNILSLISLKESARTSVLARRWRYLWRFTHGHLQFDYRDTATGNVMQREKFESWVNTVVELHQAPYFEGMVISFDAEGDEHLINPTTYLAVDSWVLFAMQKEVQFFELNLSCNVLYIFPLKRLKPYLHSISSPFCRLRNLRLVRVVITDEEVHYCLASCPNLEELCIRFSPSTRDIRVIDPPSLRVLEISRCPEMGSLEISAVSLISLTYEGGKNSLLLEKIPNLCELNVSGDFALFFLIKPPEQFSYSLQLQKLVLDFRFLNSNYRQIGACTALPQLWSLKRLELQIFKAPRQSLLFFTSLIEASPRLHEFRIELSYMVFSSSRGKSKPFPVIKVETDTEFVHRNLKVVEMGGYIGCLSEKEFLLELFKIGRESIKRVVIDTESDYYNEPALITTRSKAKKRAKDLASNLRKTVKLIVT